MPAQEDSPSGVNHAHEIRSFVRDALSFRNVFGKRDEALFAVRFCQPHVEGLMRLIAQDFCERETGQLVRGCNGPPALPFAHAAKIRFGIHLDNRSSFQVE